ncbi:MAG TPA: CarD family transcriptional regulator [Candidatus Bathyarchaeia archaeon]|nr:CarD family transcriptional regulator [Candidatus Bathyarchaeia archaeon]
MMFKPREKVVYPGHGVAILDRIVVKQVAGKRVEFFELKFLHKDMTILVPVESSMRVGIRPISSPEYIGKIFEFLAQPAIFVPYDPSIINWNKRNKEYQGRLRTGNLHELCLIYKDLKMIEQNKELSFGEKNLLAQTEELLVQEIALVQDVAQEYAVQHIRSLIGHERHV